MAIKAETGPAGGEALVRDAFTAMTPASPSLFKSEAGGEAPQARIRRPIPIFAVDLQRLCELGAGALEGAQRIGWRYLVEHGTNLDVVDLPEDRNRGPELLAGGAVGGNLARSGGKAEKITEAEIDYEPRILDLNLIGNSVLWLHNSERPSTDRFVSLADNPRELKPEALIKRLQSAAMRKLSVLSAATGEAGG
jgi:hypothetical protein